jgi:predicted ribosome quality control (RQC) complex YloA/Tae2 family protein
LIEEGKAKDFFAFPVIGGIDAKTLMEAEDLYYLKKEEEKLFNEKQARLFSTANSLKRKQEKSKADMLLRIEEASSADENRIKGELLTANLYRLKKGMTVCELENWYSPIGEKIKIALDSTKTPGQNAQRYFKLYNKQKRAKEILLPRLEKVEEEAEYVETILFSIQKAETLADLVEIEAELIELSLLPKSNRPPVKKKAPVPFRVYERDGYTILVGRNNLQNDRLLKEASGEDIWLHAQKYHSSHVIIKTGGKNPSDEVIAYAGEICAYYSSGKNGEKSL